MNLNFTQLAGVISPGTAPSERATVVTPREHKWDGTKRVALFLHGHGGDGNILVFAQFLAGIQVLGDVVGAISLGLPCLMIDAGGPNAFGNDAAQARVLEAISWCGTSKLGKGDSAIILGTSMGSILGLNVAARHPEIVKALGLIYPAPDMSYLDGSAGGDLANAYGGTTGLAAAIAADPSYSGLKLAQQGHLSGITMRGWVSNNDTVAGGYGTWTPFANAVKASGGVVPTDYNLGPVGHGDNTLLPKDDIAAWVASHV